MKTYILALVLGLTPCISLAEGVRGYVESKNLNAYRQGGLTPQINLYIHGKPWGEFGWSAWSVASKGWSEAYVGPTYAPVSWLEVSASIGIESGVSEARKAGSVWVGKGRWSALSIYEKGGSGHWFKHLATANVYKDEVAIGVYAQRLLGTGPYLQLKVKNLMLYGTVLQNRGKTQKILGLRFIFY